MEASVCPEDGAQTMDLAQYVSIHDDPFVGQVFEERYRIDGVLGKGGFGAVYRGEQLAVGRPVAIKLLHAHHADDPKEITRFQREARAIAALRHPNIVQVHDFGQTKDGFLYLVMEYLEGRTLKDIIRDEAPLQPERLIDYLVQILDGLAEAHSRGVIHRDLKPENVFCASIGRRSDVIKLLDFGIAKIIDESGAMMTLTGKGMAVGSPRYMSPEQAQAAPVSEQTDLYIVGLIMYELLTGRGVFEKSSPTDYLLAHIKEPLPPVAVDGVSLAGPLVDLVRQCLAKRPSERPESAEALMAAVKACRGRALDPSRTRTGAVDQGAGGEGMPTPPGQFRAPDLSAFRSASPRRLTPTLKPPLPPTVLERPAIPDPESRTSSPLKVFLSVFLLALALGGGVVMLWIYVQEQGASSSASRADGPHELHVDGACETTRDCAASQACIDGRCEAAD